jgi:dienelactone hydrolase
VSADLARWVPGEFTGGGLARQIYRRGTGPGVIVIHEVPGITPSVTAFADDVADAGFTVVMPSLVGRPGRAVTARYSAAVMARVCVAREFTTWATGRTSPITLFLQDLARSLHAECGGPGVGAVGMCFSGGFALGMMLDGHVAAPVLSQPSLPLAIGRRRSADLNLSPADLAEVKTRVSQGCPVMGLRFDRDRLTGTRFASLRRELGDGFLALEYRSANASDHSVLTEQRVEAAVAEVIAFLRRRLVV